MKALVLFLALTVFTIFDGKAQIYSPQLAGFSGNSVIYYTYGYYQGNIYNGIAHGVGTFYWRDGTFFHGNFYNGFYHGSGVIVSPVFGYLSGCWNSGLYAGPCQTAPNPFNSNNQVRQLVSQVYNEKPATTDYTSDVSPEGYQITRIDPNTEIGRSLLGGYR